MNNNWNLTANRFVAFFDILGFKEMVLNNSHKDVLDKLRVIQEKVDSLKTFNSNEGMQTLNLADDQTKSTTFSDSIIFFSKADSYHDFLKILIDCNGLLAHAASHQVPIKGAICYGEITVDYEKHLFFGKPIIDAFLLHEELQLLTVILAHCTEKKIKEFDGKFYQDVLTNYKVNLKTGKIQHVVMKPYNLDHIENRISLIKKYYESVSGKPRIYVDNTLEFLKSFRPPSKTDE